MKQSATAKDVTQTRIAEATGEKTKDTKLEHDKSKTAMGSRDGKVKFQIQP